MKKNIVNPIAGLLLGILIVGTTTTVPGAEATEPILINLESIVIEKSSWLGTQRWTKDLASQINGEINGPGWMKKDLPAPKSPILAGAV